MAKDNSYFPEEVGRSKYWGIGIAILVILLPWVLMKGFHYYIYHESDPTIYDVPTATEELDSLPTSEDASEPLVEEPVASVTEAKPASSQPVKKDKPPQQAINDWVKVTIQRGDSLDTIFRRLRLAPSVLQNIVGHNPHARTLARLQQGKTIEFLVRHGHLEKMIFPVSVREYITVDAVKDGYKTVMHTYPIENRPRTIHATIQGSWAQTARRHGISGKLMRDLAVIFQRDVDFRRGVHPGDKIHVHYHGQYVQNQLVGEGDILAAAYIGKSKTATAIRYTTKQGHTDYFTDQGLSMRKAYDRFPVRFSHIGSPFSLSRYHPILHYRRPHYGVDLAAPIGTPIHAIGDGRVDKIGRQSGFGNMIKIKHNGQYSSLYAHLLRFQKGVTRGTYVKRGQVIGYVGQTGLASGPHCHYEFHVNSHPKNPMTIDLPHADPISKREMPVFKAKVKQLMGSLVG